MRRSSSTLTSLGFACSRLRIVCRSTVKLLRRGLSLETERGSLERFQVVDVVQERREPLLPIPSCCLPYPLQRTWRAVLALCPGRVLLSQIPFVRALSLRPSVACVDRMVSSVVSSPP